MSRGLFWLAVCLLTLAAFLVVVGVVEVVARWKGRRKVRELIAELDAEVTHGPR